MAKKNKNDSGKASEPALENKKNNTAAPADAGGAANVQNKNTKQKESHGGLIAAVIAFVALLFIGGGIIAFVFLVKAKKTYVDPYLQRDAADLGSNAAGNNLYGDVSSSGEGMGEALPPGNVSPVNPSAPAVPVAPAAPDDSVVTPPPPPPADDNAADDEDVADDEDAADAEDDADTEEDDSGPVPVGSYNFDAQPSAMDSQVEAVQPDDLDSSKISDSALGFQ